MSYSDELEALLDERAEADFQQAEMEAAGREVSRKMRRYAALRKAGKLAEAAAACPHGWGYPLNSLAAERNNDPNVGETGVRCLDCGSRLSAWAYERDSKVIVPCELAGEESRR